MGKQIHFIGLAAMVRGALEVVAEGGLWLTETRTGSTVQNNVSTPVTVYDGAVIGGSGKMGSDLTIEAGGGFLVDATNTTARLTVEGAVTLPTEGLIRLYNVEAVDETEIDYEGLPLPVAVNGTVNLDEVNASAWKVEIDGWGAQESRHVSVQFDALNGTFDVKYQRRGTRILIQ